MSERIQTQIAWACVNRYGDVANSTIRTCRKDAIKAFGEDMPNDWRYWRRKHGWTCQRVAVGAILVEQPQ